MKSVTEFPSFTLTKALQTKAALVADGKTPEEIQTSLAETFKLEGDKAKFFMNALEIAGQNTQNLKRVVVVTLNEGETAPAKATKVEDHHYIVEMITTARPATDAGDKSHGRGGRGKGRGGDNKKGSPWGMSPEEKAAKNAPKQK
jgi:hypothetical protein